MDGYDLSGYSREVGPLLWGYDEQDQTCLPDAVKGVLPGVATVGITKLNGVFDNTATSGLHVLLNGAGTKRTAMIPIGIQAEPAQGDPVYMGQFEQASYTADGNPAVYVSAQFDKTSAAASTLLYDKPWGWLLRPKTATTAVNSAVGIDDVGASTAFGGYMVYQVFAGNGTATIKVQDAATNSDGSFSDLSGATTGSINCAVVQHGLIALGRTATVRRYLRWQIALGTATSVTFALGFSRATF
jgi:hypothetical protein